MIRLAVALLALTACTPAETELWHQWHAVDPVTAERFANDLPQFRPARSAPAVEHGVWDQLAECESGGNWQAATGNGYYGGLQFSLRSWRGVGGTGYPHHATREEQIARAERLLDVQGWGAWPACSRRLGLR